MQQANFHPNVHSDSSTDAVATGFLRLAQNILVVVLGLLPVIFIPIAYAPFNFTKTMLVVAAVTVALLFLSFAVLRTGEINMRFPLLLVALWSVAGASLLSAVFSGDISDSLMGDSMGVRTALFACLMALVASMMLMLRSSKMAIIRLYLLLVVSASLLFVYHLVRVLWGESVLSFGFLTSTTATPLGDWNDLAMLFGLVIIIIMMALEQLPLARVSQSVLSVVLVASLFMLAVINYSAVWIVLGVVSLIQLMYTLTKHRFSSNQLQFTQNTEGRMLPVVLTAIVFLTSLSFVIAGPTFGAFIAEKTGVSYIEVRPSLTATLGVTRETYESNPLLGIGANRFADAWRQFKNPQINETVFWDVGFESGSGFVPTTFVTTGILGALAWLFFFAALLYTAAKMIFTSQPADTLWYFIGTSSLVATGYFWLIALIYNPAVVMMLIAAACTGIYAAAYTTIVPHRTLSFFAGSSRALGVLLIGVVILVVVGSVSGVYTLSRHYTALWSFNHALAETRAGGEIDKLEDAAANAYQTTANDTYARELAYYQFLRLNGLYQIEDPTEEQVQEFQDAAALGVQAARAAVSLDPSDPRNHIRLGEVYSILAATGVSGSSERAIETFEIAKGLDPFNPRIPFLRAQHAVRTGDTESARSYATAAITLKSNYTDALILLAQLDIAAGNTDAAIERVRAVITYEPNNPARHYQLGVLQLSAEQLEAAELSFRRAINLDNGYANARYYLAIVYLRQEQPQAALEQLRVVAEFNPDNTDIAALIARIESGELTSLPAAGADVATPTATSNEGEVTVDGDPQTDLVTPVNTLPAESEESEEEDTASE